MSGMDWVYLLVAGVLASAALVAGLQAAHPTRWRSCGFFALLAAMIVLAELLPPALLGLGVVCLLALACAGLKAMPARTDVPEPAQLSRLLAPALLLPALTISLSLAFNAWPPPALAASQQPLLALALASLTAWLWAVVRTRAAIARASLAGGELLDSIGWAPILPLFLAITRQHVPASRRGHRGG